MNKLMALAVLGAGNVLTCHAADWCKFTASRSVTLEAAGARTIVITAGAGELSIHGQSARNNVQADGRACASSREVLDRIQLESRREGDVLYVRTVLPKLDDGLLGFSRYATMDLEVVLPASLQAQVEDSSGDLELAGVAAAVVMDSSGDIDIDDIAGRLEVTDSSGDIEIERIGGPLSLQDSSGDIELAGIQGPVEIPVDSSGEIHIENVSGGVHIRTDSSGEIVIAHVRNDVVIDSDSSGDISVEDVGGRFTVGADSSGSIRHTRVTGAVQLPAR